MRKILYLFALILMGSMAQAQNCAANFGSGAYQVTVVCTPSGVSSYQLTINQVTGTTFTMAGIRGESQGVVTATCTGNTFNFPMTAFPSGNSVVGTGTNTGTGTINIAYGVYNANGMQIDSCVGTYNVPVGLFDAAPSFDAMVSPNPAQTQAQITVSGIQSLQGYSFEVFDMQGKRILNGDLLDNAANLISVATWNSGVYKVVVTSPEGRVVKSLIKN